MAKQQTIKLGKDVVRLVDRSNGNLEIIIENKRDDPEFNQVAYVTINKKQTITLAKVIAAFAEKL